MSLRAELLRLGTRALLKPRSQTLDIAGWRRTMRVTERLVPPPPSRCQATVIEANGLTMHQVTMPASLPRRRVLHLHGGGYVGGSPAHCRHLTWRIAEALRASVVTPAYRLAPEHPFPAALDDAAGAYAHLAGGATDTSELFLMGDSAGGGLVLALLIKLRDEGRPLPRAAVALSPWTDLALTGASLEANASADPMLNASLLPALTKLYLAGTDPHTPYASPLYGDVTGLPPVLIQVGSDEILRDDATRMAEKLRQHNPQSRVEVWPRMPHGWQLFLPVLPEAHQAIAKIGEFIAAVESA